MNRLKLGLIFGGACEEHPISVKSAREEANSAAVEVKKAKP